METFTRSIIFIALFLFGYALAPAQSTTEGFRVRIISTPKASETEREFNGLLRLELNKLKTVRFTSRSDYDIACAAIRLKDGERNLGYAVSTMVVEPDRRGYRDFTLFITAGKSLEVVASEVAEKLEAAYFSNH